MAAKVKGRVVLFVYGTLKEGFPLNPDWMSRGEKIEDKWILDNHALLDFGAYPGLVSLPSEHHYVEGELWALPFDMFIQLRRMEERVGYSTVKVGTTTFQNKERDIFAFRIQDLPRGLYKWSHGHNADGVEVTNR